MSARKPSAPAAAQAEATARSRGGAKPAGRAAASRRRRASSSRAHPPANTAASASNARRRATASALASGPVSAVTSTHRPNRSRSCGRSSPSSGFIDPTRTKRLSCTCETPSRSTLFTPLAATSRSRSTRWSGRRFTSSTYRTPPWAACSSPGRRRSWPWASMVRRSSEPARRSSVVPTGSSTNGTRSPNKAARPRARVVLPLPFWPRRSTPPMRGSTALRRRASFTSS